MAKTGREVTIPYRQEMRLSAFCTCYDWLESFEEEVSLRKNRSKKSFIRINIKSRKSTGEEGSLYR